MSGPAPARRAAQHALIRLSTTSARVDERPSAFPEFADLDARDRRLASELVTGTVKRRLSLDAVLASFAAMPLARIERDVLECLRLGAFQLLFLERVPAHAAVDDAVSLAASHGRRTRGFVNAVLRAVDRDGRARLAALGAGQDLGARSIRWSCPPWLVAVLYADLGREAAERLLGAANEAPERCLRVNRLRADVATARAALSEAGVRTCAVDGLADALVYEGPPLEGTQPFARGLVTPQSRASQLAGIIAAESPGPVTDMLDLCAAPGAKTSQIAAARPVARLTAVEVDHDRAVMLRANLRRLGASSVEVVEADGLDLAPSFAAAFDTVLVDAPCSGLGTLASRADLRWRRAEADVPRLAARQRALLGAASRYVRPGGRLTYAVCTVTAAETTAVVDAVVKRGEWVLDDLGATFPDAAHPANGAFLLALPPAWGTTAFFVARLRRRAP